MYKAIKSAYATPQTIAPQIRVNKVDSGTILYLCATFVVDRMLVPSKSVTFD